MSLEIEGARQSAELWARDRLAHPDWLILDSETTGLRGSEVVNIGILSARGKVLLDVLVHPTGAIPLRVQQIHGITPEDVADAVSFPILYPVLAALVSGKRILIYNAEFDTGILAGECDRHQLAPLPWASTQCVMLQYAAWYGEWDEYHGDFRRQKLLGGDHTAIGDCRAALAVITAMAK